MLVLNIHYVQLIVKTLKQLAAIAANFFLTIQESFKKISKNSIKNSQHPWYISVLAWQALTQDCTMFYYPQLYKDTYPWHHFVADIFITLQND